MRIITILHQFQPGEGSWRRLRASYVDYDMSFIPCVLLKVRLNVFIFFICIMLLYVYY
jgi:hypothetical protein